MKNKREQDIIRLERIATLKKRRERETIRLERIAMMKNRKERETIHLQRTAILKNRKEREAIRLQRIAVLERRKSRIKSKKGSPPIIIKAKSHDIITAITPTGDRRLAFALCQNWMRNQTLQPDQWIVIDDGKVPMKPFVSMEYVRREPQPHDPQFTLCLNLKMAAPLIRGNKIIIIEDDEYYAAGYIAEMARRLSRHEVVGISQSEYYHLPSGGYLKIGNPSHASLAQTAFRRSFLPDFREAIDGVTPYLDIRLWRKARKDGRGMLFATNVKNPLYLGIKGLPGRAGIGHGHNPGLYRRLGDPSRKVLRQWILDDDDYNIYMDVIAGKLTEKNHSFAIRDVTGITVCYNTKEFIERAYRSVRKFHPDMPIIIIDGSDAKDPCASYVKRLASNLTTVVSLGYNIGHGRGMCKGIGLAKTKYALIFDSDIEMLKSPVRQMLRMMEEDTYGVGYNEKTGFDGFVYGVRRHHAREGWMFYLHPYFQLINIANYKKFHPYVHHGAPCYLAMLDIHKRGLSSKILKEFPGLGHSKGATKKHIRHELNGTRGLRERRGLPPIEKGWEYK